MSENRGQPRMNASKRARVGKGNAELRASRSKSTGTKGTRPSPVGTLELVEEKAINVSLLRAREAVMVHMRPILRASGFTEQQWRVLRSLSRTVPIDKTTLSERAMLLMPSLLRILRDLENMGFVKSIPSPHNLRLARIILSAKGEAAYAKTYAEISVMGRIVREQIGVELVDQLLTLLSTVEQRLTGLSAVRTKKST